MRDFKKKKMCTINTYNQLDVRQKLQFLNLIHFCLNYNYKSTQTTDFMVILLWYTTCWQSMHGLILTVQSIMVVSSHIYRAG